jgi:hypothetical protein
MKKLIALLSFLILFTGFNCENEPLEGDFVIDEVNACTEANDEVQDAKVNFDNASELNYSELCNIYKTALQKKLTVCGDDGILQDLIESLGNCV